MKLATNNGRFLIFSETQGIALYYENYEFKNEDGGSQTRQKIVRVVRNGQREWSWALKTWGQEPQGLERFEEKLLNRAQLFFVRKVKTLAIKNSKGSSAVLWQSNFFLAPQSGYLITCGKGSTSRRVHQGGNSWKLFNFQKVEKSQEKVAGTSCDFGTYCGCDNHFGGITEEELISLTQGEWEELSGVKFSLMGEFGWFKASVDGQPQLHGLHREGNYVLRVPFRPHSEMGELAVYSDISQPNRGGWGEEMVSGYENPLTVGSVGVEIPGCKNFVVVEDQTSDGIRKIYFANFQFFNFPSFWVGYETITETTADAVAGIKLKATSHMLANLNYKLRRNNGVDSKKVLGFFKSQGAFMGTPADSMAVGNCAVGTWEWMRKIFPRLLETDSISWQHFPVPVRKEFKIPFERMEQLFEDNYRFRAVVEHIYLKKNPTSGALTTETASQLLFNPIEESIGKIITKWEAKKFLGVSIEVMDDKNLVHHQVEKINSENSIPTTLGDVFGEEFSMLKNSLSLGR